MKKEQNIEQLFQNKFSSFEPKVNPNAWNAINSKLGTNVSGASATTSVSKTLVSSFFAAVTMVVGVAGNAIYNNVQQDKKEVVVNNSNEQNASLVSSNVDNTIKKIEVVSVEKVFEDIDKSADADQVISDNISNIKSELTTSNKQFNAVDELLEHQIDALIRANRIDKTDLTDISLSEDPIVEVVSDDHTNASTVIDCSFTYNISEQDYHMVLFSANCKSDANYTWNFDDGEVSTEKNPKHYYNQEGTYEVKLEVSNDSKVEKYSMKVVVTEPSMISKVPNVFTPNGDFYNDYYFIESNNIESLEATIIDRNGQVVFESKDPNFKWNGNDFFGEPAAEGGYVCVIKAVGKDGKKHTKTKSFVLKR